MLKWTAPRFAVCLEWNRAFYREPTHIYVLFGPTLIIMRREGQFSCKVVMLLDVSTLLIKLSKYIYV